MTPEEGSEYDRLFYPFLFAGGTANVEDVLAQVRHSTLEKCRDVVALRRKTFEVYGNELVAAAMAMAQAFTAGATLWAFGNGGSTTDAQDVVADLLNPPFPLSRPLPAVALTNDVAVVTAVANDVGFDNIFARQIIAFSRPGDIALGISTSGNSTNVSVALAQAKQLGLLTVGFAGYDGGKMANAAALDFCIVAHSDQVPRIQEAQATAYHALLEAVYTLLHT
ncbi:MAG: SIS domain-containing protein [Chloroflexota bacterium]|nr:SIS domain-containing protein [Chloroflexota bacterium]PLS78985.1 MAG: phosphoheptose isomerase [Chloroflexota bacterium]